ncbi:hypothetical protein [Streptomyces sp. NPDC059786]|uniref:hypothetical protein n=1 Tax=Streptomyces sp. NPDC059786 TaxID=3346946 RepID=UPI003661B838
MRTARLLPRRHRDPPRLSLHRLGALTAAHVLQVATLFEEKAQDELFGADGDFRAASTVVPVGVAEPGGEGHVVREAGLLDLPVEGGSPGSVLHGNPMYAGRAAAFFHGELAAIMIGTAYAAADEYARLVAARPLVLDPAHTRADLHDYQRHLGEALGTVHLAEAALQRTAEDWTEACGRNVSGEAPFTTAVDNRLALVFLEAGRLAWNALQGILFRTTGYRHARDGERTQRYFRDAATYWTHVGPSMAEPLQRRVGRDRLGLPSDDIPLVP